MDIFKILGIFCEIVGESTELDNILYPFCQIMVALEIFTRSRAGTSKTTKI